MTERYINGKQCKGESFAFDGCHKIYVVEGKDDEKKMRKLGYEILPISELPWMWATSCPLRFIYSANLERQFAHQGETAVFDGFELDAKTRREVDDLNSEIALYSGRLT